MFASRTTQVIPNLARLPGLEQLLPTILRGLPPEVCGLLATHLGHRRLRAVGFADGFGC